MFNQRKSTVETPALPDPGPFTEKETKVEYTVKFDGQEFDRHANGYGEWGPRRVYGEGRAKAENARRGSLGFAPPFRVYRRLRTTLVSEWIEVPDAENGAEMYYDEQRQIEQERRSSEASDG